jgi:tetratricopeptide (TPR) repeat protein
MAPGDAARCQAWIGLAVGMRVTDRYDEAFLVLDRAEKLAVKHHLAVDLARLHHLRGNLYFPIGKTEDCLREHKSALEYAEASCSPENEARALSGLGDAEYARGRLLTAYGYFRRCLEICREHGFGRIGVSNVAQVAHIQHYFKEMPNVLADTLKAIEATARVSHHRAEVVARLTAVDDLFDLGEMAQATEHLERVQAVEEKLGAKRYRGRRLTYAAQIVRAEGRHSEALDLLERAIKSCRETGMSYFGPVALAELALTTNDLEIREKSLEEGERILHSGSMSRNHFWFYRAAMEIGLIEGNWEKVDRYASALEDYTRAEPLPWTDLFITRGRALAAFGRGKRDDTTIHELQRVRDEAEGIGLKTALPALEEALSRACGHAPRPVASK